MKKTDINKIILIFSISFLEKITIYAHPGMHKRKFVETEASSL
jgi:hypothetical protein